MNACECCGSYRADVELYETQEDWVVLLCRSCALDLRPRIDWPGTLLAFSGVGVAIVLCVLAWWGIVSLIAGAL